MGGQELVGGGYEQARVRTAVWEAASSLLGRAGATPARVLRERVLRTYRDKVGDVRISRVRARIGGTSAHSSECGEGHPDSPGFFWFHVRLLAASSPGEGTAMKVRVSLGSPWCRTCCEHVHVLPHFIVTRPVSGERE